MKSSITIRLCCPGGGMGLNYEPVAFGVESDDGERLIVRNRHGVRFWARRLESGAVALGYPVGN